MKIYLLIALSLCGFVTVAQEIKVDTIKANDLKDVVVTGQYGPQTLRNSVYNVKTISADRIKLRAATNVQQILNTELGFRFSNDLTLGTTDVSLMGMTGRNIKILLDGVPMVDRSDARESLNQIDINTIERIEIVEGPMSVVYGTDALAGVINIITKNPGKQLLSVNARVQEESAGKEYNLLNGAGQHNQNLSISWQQKGWSVLLGASHNDFGGWNMAPKTSFLEEFNSYKNQWKPKEQWLGNTKIGYRNQNFSIWYRLDGLKEDIDSRFGINPSSFEGKLSTYTTKRYTQQLQSEWRVNNKLQITAIGGYTDLQRSTHTVIHNFTNNTERLSDDKGEQDIAKFNSVIFRSTAIYTLNKSVSFQPGIEYNRDAASGQRINGAPVINDYAAFISAEIKLDNGISLRPGLRFIKNSIYDAPPVIPSLNTKFTLTKDLDLRLAYAKGFRSPALRELYYDFVDASHNILGNPNLKAEESNSFNGSLAWAGIHEKDLQFRSTLSGFYNLFKNRINFAQSPTDNSITSLFNVDKYKTTGATLDNTLIYKDVQATLGVSYIGRYNELSMSNPDLGTPEFAWATEVNSNITYTLPKINGSISLFYKYTGSLPNYKLTAENDPNSVKLTKIGDFHTADLMLNKNLFKSLTINAGIKNLFDVTQLSNTSTATGGAHSTGGDVPYSYGRSYVLGLTYNWNKL
ncbi:TonB-dependent receptor [Pedobacter sp. ISL-68]|uniref:TonB-dependent receptor plug domain-containing protein n=1 Tax=unclassified Pedobacter TaxID=2628915 RepID=UPI001BE58952|nr:MULTISPECIES: TonB-dependent receptor [unclassified Pedobacter]MBT2562017.1 TonB-dependent receptor [Pedobacter sp. ISL-64]MBT2591604.1 TonB-dependent receptor [Pedobacter sp. ISL-68]